MGSRRTPVTAVDLLADSFRAVRSAVDATVEGLTAEQLAFRPSPTSNSITWLIWHLSRVQDDQVARAFGRDQVWSADGWTAHFALPFDSDATGYGQSPEEAATVWVESGALLTEYHDAVSQQTLELMARLSDHDLARVVDETQDQSITLGIRLNSIANDDLQHVGQAGYVRGLLGHGLS